MLAAFASLLILLLFAFAIGQALISVSLGVRRGGPIAPSWLAPVVGLAAMLVLAGVTARLPGHGWTAAIALLVAAGASAWWLRGRLKQLGAAMRVAAPVVLITTFAASIPFLAAGGIGVLGAGLINDDMASHLLIADYVREPEGFVPSFIRGGYPTGPHAVVVALSEGLGADLVSVFAGFTMALAPLTGLLALGLLGADIGRIRRIVGASLVALPYLAASFISSGAFKEPLQALILIAFAVLLAQLVGIRTAADPERRDLRRLRPIVRVMPLAVLAAASVFNYSLPGLLWIGAVGVVVLAARLWVVRPRPKLPPDWRWRFAPYLIGGLLVVVLATVQEWSRIADFARLEALNPDRFGSDLGNLKQAISPLEALGVWPTGDYRTAATDAGPPAVAFYLGAAVALVGLAIGLIDARRRDLWALPAALLAVAIVWAVTALFSTPYIAAKALAIASPLVMLIALRGLLGSRGPLAAGLTVVLVILAGASSLLALRQAAVGPDDHASELAEVRGVVQGEEVLFLGRDDFIAYELAGSDEITGIVTNFYSVADARPRFQAGEGGGEKFDIDAVFPRTLDQFRFILETRGGPTSSPPPRFDPVVETENYVLYERTGDVGRRKTLDEGISPGAVLDCDRPEGREVASGQGTAQVWSQEPIVLAPAERSTPGTGVVEWEPSSSPTDSQPAAETLELPRGRWLISLQYDSRRPLRVSAPELGFDAELPANLDFRVTDAVATPFFPVGEVEVDRRTEAELTVAPAEPNAFGRLLGVPNEAHLGSLSATPQGVISRIQRRQACGQYVDWYRAR
ncbi:MAG TPA: hypothetical protein VKA36_00170 [Solirubrobacterales bacterium]|nr:hypothetical protein [Solirubrobacterales bacterium]